MFGLSPEWLLYDGRPIPSSLVLSHTEQLERLSSITPAAVDVAVVAGDPCYDRMLRSAHLRERYREALGVGPGRRLIAVCTTWWRRSLLGTWPSIYRELLACLPADEYQVAALVHPNIWHGHGPWQLHTWLADCTRAGMVIVSPVDAWQAALIAADLVIGDHGATTCYGAAVGRPVLLAAFPEDDVAPGSAVDLLGRRAPRINRHKPLRAQVADAMRQSPRTYDHVRELVSSYPGESAVRLRKLCYEHLDLPEPAGAPPVPVIPVGSVASLSRPYAHADHVVCTLAPGGATITRYPADVHVDRATAGHLDAAFLVVHEDHPRQSLLDEAAIVLVPLAGHENPEPALAEALRRHRGATVVAASRSETVFVRTREGRHLTLRVDDVTAAASLVHAWLLANRDLDGLPGITTIRAGSTEIAVEKLT